MSDATLEFILAEHKRMTSDNARLIAENSRLTAENSHLNTAKNNAIAEQERLSNRLQQLQTAFDENIVAFNKMKADAMSSIEKLEILLRRVR